MSNIYLFFKNYWIRLVVAFGIAITLFISYLSIYTMQNSWTSLIHYCNATFIAGFSLLMISALALCTYFGGFDIFSYLVMRKPVNENRKENFYEYCERKKERRSKRKLTFLPYLIVAVIFLTAAVITYFLI